MKLLKYFLGFVAILAVIGAILYSTRKAPEAAAVKPDVVEIYGYNIDRANPDIASIKKDAESGNAVAQFVYGALQMVGNGVPQDKTEGIKWVTKSAENGFAYAQAALGACYEDGNGVPRDREKAFKWLRKAAANGSSEAQEIIIGIKNEQPGELKSRQLFNQ